VNGIAGSQCQHGQDHDQRDNQTFHENLLQRQNR
jgi:hypothetical protein